MLVLIEGNITLPNNYCWPWSLAVKITLKEPHRYKLSFACRDLTSNKKFDMHLKKYFHAK